MEIGIIIVWYHPTDEQKENTLKLTRNTNMKICVVDNSDKPDHEILLMAEQEGSIGYVHNANNGGIAGAYNRGFSELILCDDIKYIFTMDQDSKLEPKFFIDMVQFSIQNKAFITCPNFYDRNAQTYGTFLLLTPFFYEITSNGQTHFCISSGMCISRVAWELLAPFDEELIIDHVDTAFALKAYKNNINIMVNYEICLDHAIGERRAHKFLGVTIKPNHHSHIRKYYIVRNGTYLAIKNYGITKGYFNLNILRVIHEYISVILYEKSKLKKLQYMTLGLFDGIRGKLGVIK